MNRENTGIPDWVKQIRSELKEEFGSIEIKKQNSTYYVYRTTSKYHAELKRSKKISLGCIGKVQLGENGAEFIPNGNCVGQNSVQSAKNHLYAYYYALGCNPSFCEEQEIIAVDPVQKKYRSADFVLATNRYCRWAFYVMDKYRIRQNDLQIINHILLALYLEKTSADRISIYVDSKALFELILDILSTQRLPSVISVVYLEGDEKATDHSEYTYMEGWNCVIEKQII